MVGVRGLFQQAHMVRQAVVVIEEAIADKSFALREIGPRLVTAGLVWACAVAAQPNIASATRIKRKIPDILCSPIDFVLIQSSTMHGIVALFLPGAFSSDPSGEALHSVPQRAIYREPMMPIA